MPILKPKKKRLEYRLVGAFVPPLTYHYMNLYTLATDTPKARIVKNLLDEWVTLEQSSLPENKLLWMVIKKAKEEWNMQQSDPRANFSEFIKTLNSELVVKGLSDDNINFILKMLTNEEANSKKSRTT